MNAPAKFPAYCLVSFGRFGQQLARVTRYCYSPRDGFIGEKFRANSAQWTKAMRIDAASVLGWIHADLADAIMQAKRVDARTLRRFRTRSRCYVIAPIARCPDCGEPGARQGHMECQFPGRSGAP